MIIVTGAAGFIGSNLIAKLNKEGFYNIIAVDLAEVLVNRTYLENLRIHKKLAHNLIPAFIEENQEEIEFVFHLGAITDTTETDVQLLAELNTEYSITLWDSCYRYQLPLIYASSAATYGDGSQGFSDDHSKIKNLEPLNPYAKSKQLFDEFAINSENQPFFWAGLKFFNVYGPNEDHKGKMASMIHQMNIQVLKNGVVKLFKSNDKKISHGEQSRDFISVRDVIMIMYWFFVNRNFSGIYNVGTGTSVTFNQVAKRIFENHYKKKQIEYISIPSKVSGKYQNWTESNVQKLRLTGYNEAFLSVRDGINWGGF